MTTNNQDPINEIQWRNIRKVVRAAADHAFGGKDDPRYGHCWLAVVQSLTAKDGIDAETLQLEPLQPAAAQQQGDAREALRRIKYEAVSLADAQVIALEALQATAQASGPSAASIPLKEWPLYVFAKEVFLGAYKPEELSSAALKAMQHQKDMEGRDPGVHPAAPARAVEPLTPEQKAAIHDLRALHKQTTPGEWGKGRSTHHTVSRHNGQQPYHIAEFHHADDAAFLDVAHKYVPALLDLIERAHGIGIPATTPTQAAKGGEA